MIDIQKSNQRIDYQIFVRLVTEILHEVNDPIIPAEDTDYVLGGIPVRTGH
ncbi:hypothetical protein [Pontibacter sp. G13]|uniref:hypothetical protein n=1 Tax=Pontibacter sp. G13 TaxID=3074898 RepID=UPI0028895677|nr:hypothetical protein [Pontibacter sp. G13]WNJ17886.1 hypothetical protein RJD25_23785 [Pontibacter sp. G13]